MGRPKSRILFYSFSARQIEHIDLNGFLDLYGPGWFAKEPKLSRWLGAMVLHFEEPGLEGYAFSPAFRRFALALLAAWPYGGFFLDLAQEDFRLLVYAALDSLKIIALEGQANRAVLLSGEELDRILAEQQALIREWAELQGLRSQLIARRMREMKAYFR